MNYAERMNDGLKRDKACRALASRFKKIKKKSPARSMAAICDAYGLGDKGYISRVVRGEIGASWDKINTIARALDAEYILLGMDK
jgi:hypothetical protein